MPRPRVSILNPKFRYTPAAGTDLKKTFARIRRQQRAEAARVADGLHTVLPLRKTGSGS